MTEDRRAKIEAAIAELEAQAPHWTNQQVYKRVRGSYRELSRYLKDRRAQGHVSIAAVGIVDPPEPLAPAPVPAPPGGHGQLGDLRAAYRQLAQAADGLDHTSDAVRALGRLHGVFAQQCATAREALVRARRLAPVVERMRVMALNWSTGRPDAVANAAQLARAETPQAALYHSALRVLTEWVGEAEAQRLVNSTDIPSWSLA